MKWFTNVFYCKMCKCSCSIKKCIPYSVPTARNFTVVKGSPTSLSFCLFLLLELYRSYWSQDWVPASRWKNKTTHFHNSHQSDDTIRRCEPGRICYGKGWSFWRWYQGMSSMTNLLMQLAAQNWVWFHTGFAWTRICQLVDFIPNRTFW